MYAIYSQLVDDRIFYVEDFYYNNEWNRIVGAAASAAAVGGDIGKEWDDAQDYIYNIILCLYIIHTYVYIYRI